MVDLPAPIIPTSTTERAPSAAVISASWVALALAGEAVSGIAFARSPQECGVPRDHTTPADTVARELLQRNGEHGGSQASPISMVNSPPEALRMPSLFRFLTVVAVIVGIVYGVIFALANFVNPKPREMTVTIPPDKFLKK